MVLKNEGATERGGIKKQNRKTASTLPSRHVRERGEGCLKRQK